MAKFNVFGRKEDTIGQNVMHAVTGDEQVFGFPDCKITAAVQIMHEALNYDERDLLFRGYGIGRERQSQKQIARELKTSEAEVSRRAWAAIDKLKKSPYKARMKALVPSVAEINEMIIEAMETKNYRKENKELRYRLESKASLVDDLWARNKELERKLGMVEYNLGRRTKDLREREGEVKELMDKIIVLRKEVAFANGRAENSKRVLDALLLNVEQAIETTKKDIVTSVVTCEVETFDSLGICEEQVKMLASRKIYTVDRLRQMTPEGLRKMVGKEMADDILRRLNA